MVGKKLKEHLYSGKNYIAIRSFIKEGYFFLLGSSFLPVSIPKRLSLLIDLRTYNPVRKKFPPRIAAVARVNSHSQTLSVITSELSFNYKMVNAGAVSFLEF